MKKLFLVLLIFLISCASLPVEKPCEQWDIRFIVLEGFEVQHKSCDDMDVVTWKIDINVCDEGKWKTTNLWSTWDGCDYVLYQQFDKDIDFLGYFSNLDKMEKFLKANLYKARIK